MHAIARKVPVVAQIHAPVGALLQCRRRTRDEFGGEASWVFGHSGLVGIFGGGSGSWGRGRSRHGGSGGEAAGEESEDGGCFHFVFGCLIGWVSGWVGV